MVEIVQVPGKSKLVELRIGVKAGAMDERENEAGLTHYCEHAAFRKTGPRGTGCLHLKGARFNAMTTSEYTVFTLGCGVDNNADIVEIVQCFTTMIQAMKEISDEHFEAEKIIVVEELKMRGANPARMLYINNNILVFGHDSPYGQDVGGTPSTSRRKSTDPQMTLTLLTPLTTMVTT